MRYLGSPFLFLLVPLTFAAEPLKDKRPAELIKGLGEIHHPISTKNAEAQKFFDQGLMLIYAFNHDEAARAFKRASELDPNLAMAWWGIALAKGPNYNLDADENAAKASDEAIGHAMKLCSASSSTATEPEKAYIKALRVRYSSDPKPERKKLSEEYAKTMKELSAAYPDDLDAATLYAESLMNLRPWELWTAEGKPAEGTEEIIRVLESVLRRNPNHTGANHYYIHTVEASPNPERGLASAVRLGKIAPAAGHLVHMPAHIYIRIGDHAAAAESNEKAILADEQFLKTAEHPGVYGMMYYSHNIHFLAVARAMQGRYDDAKKAADKLAAHVGPHVADMPMLEGFLPTPTFVMVRFQRWDDVLASKPPGEKLKTTRALWHFARALAYLAKNKTDEAERERKDFRALRKAIPEDVPFSDRNSAQAVLAVAEPYLDAKFAAAGKDHAKAAELLRQAIQAEDALKYMEPPDWYLMSREALGGVLHAAGEFKEAEKVFRADLERNRRNPRSLFGLRECLKAQKNDHAARLVDQQFQSAWKDADRGELRMGDY